MQIGVIGLGIVGGNLYKYFEKEGYNVLGYDVVEDMPTSRFDDVAKSDVIFLCLPTPYLKDGGFDCSIIEETIERIKNPKTFVIKSTVVPGTTDRLQKKYPDHDFIFSPEFLTEKYAWEDTVHPDSQIIGYTKQSRKLSQEILNILPEAPYEKIMPASEAEMVKYVRNVFFTTKVVFMNLIYDICQSENMDYEPIKEALASDRRVRRSHMEIWHQGGRGGGGKCFPKDLGSFIQKVVKDKNKRTHIGKFFHLVQDINNHYLDSTEKTRGNQYEL